MSTETDNHQPDLIAYAVSERKGRSFFRKIGVAWQNKKGGFNTDMVAYPAGNCSLVFLPPREDDPAEESAQQPLEQPVAYAE